MEDRSPLGGFNPRLGEGGEPLDLSDRGEGKFLSDRKIEQLTWGFVVLGVVLRTVRYAMNHPLWGDEAFVAANFLTRDYLDLLKPLDYFQVCPPLFLWVELAIVRLLGFRELTLRLFPTLCGVASVFVFRHVASRFLKGVPLLLAVAIFAVSFAPNRHSAEVKPYATDLLVALVLLCPAVEWWRRPDRARWLWGLAAITPLAMGFSYPSMFVAGGLSLALLLPVWRTGRWSIRLPFLMYNLAIAATFLLLYTVVLGPRDPLAERGLKNYWANAFPPPWTEPIRLAIWFVEIHTSHTFAYPIGGARGASVLTTLLVVVAAVGLWRRERTVLALLLAPFGLGLVAATIGRYPYGGSARTMQYVTPAICMMAGLGAATVLARLRRPGAPRRALRFGLLTLAVIGLGPLGRDIVCPYKEYDDHKTREFARWFWKAMARDAEVACIKTDLGEEFDWLHWQLGRTAVYLCNQKIYSPRHRRGTPLPWDRISDERPLRVILYNEEPLENPEFQDWLRSMRTRYNVRDVQRFVPIPGGVSHGVWLEDRYVVYEFVPKHDPSRIAGEAGDEPARR